MAKSRPISKKRCELFTAELRRHGNVTRAAESIRLSRTTAYRRRQTDPEFSTAWEDGEQAFLDGLETEAVRRAFVGVDRPVFQGGKQVGSVRDFSDRLAEFILDRKRYPARQKHEHTGADGQPIEVRTIRRTIVKHGDGG